MWYYRISVFASVALLRAATITKTRSRKGFRMKTNLLMYTVVFMTSLLFAGGSHLSFGATKAFPSVPPLEKPHRSLSEAMHRFYDDYDALHYAAC